MAQNLNPNSDNAQSQWVLTGAISRSVALSDASDGSYVQAANTTQVLKLGLTSPGGVPGSLKNWKILFRGRSITSAVTLILKLVINGVVKVTYTQASIPVSFSLTDYSYTLTFSEAASIDEDIDNVELWLTRSPGTGSIRVVKTQVQVADVTPSSRISSAEARGLSGPIPILNPVAEARSFSGPILITTPTAESRAQSFPTLQSLPTTQARAESAEPLVSMISPSARALSNQVLSNLPAAEGRAESFAPLRVLSVAFARAESFAFSFPLDSAKARASVFSPLTPLIPSEARALSHELLTVLQTSEARALSHELLTVLQTSEARGLSFPPTFFEVPTASARAFTQELLQVLAPSESRASAESILQALQTPQSRAFSLPPLLFFEMPTPSARAFSEALKEVLDSPQARALSYPPEDTSLFDFEGLPGVGRSGRIFSIQRGDRTWVIIYSLRHFLFATTPPRQFFKSDRAMTFSATQRLQEFPFVPGEILTLTVPMNHIEGDHTGAVFAVESIDPVGSFVADVVEAYQEGCKIGAIQISGGDLSQAAGYIVTVSLELPAKNNDKVYRCLKFLPVPCVG